MAVVFWHPDDVPSVLWLTATPVGHTSLLVLSPNDPRQVAMVDGEEGRHVVARTASGCLRAVILPASIDAPSFAAVVPLDEQLPERLVEIERHALARRIAGIARLPDPLSRLQRRRLGLMLRTFDARLVGASYRVIAEVLLGVEQMPAREWKSHSLRNQIRRAFADAVEMVGGEYRRLLRPYRHIDRRGEVP